MPSVIKPSRGLDEYTFVDDMFGFVQSPAGILFEQVRQITWVMLEQAKVDSHAQQIIWEDGQPRDIPQSAQLIIESIETGQGVTKDLVEDEIVGWLEMGHIPEGFTDKQLAEHEQRDAVWIENFVK